MSICLLLASVAGPVLMKSTTQRFSLRPKNRLYLLNVTKPHGVCLGYERHLLLRDAIKDLVERKSAGVR